MAALGVTGVIATAPAGAVTAGHQHRAASTHAVAHPKGFFVSDSGQATSSTAPAALVRDADGGEHVITSDPSSTVGMSHLVYVTRHQGATHWTSHAIPGLRPNAGQIKVEAHLSEDNTRVVIVMYECDGVFIADAGIRAVRMAEPTQVIAEDNCATATATSNDPPIADALAIPGREVDILWPDPNQGNQQELFLGTPGTRLSGASNPIPTTDDITIDQVTQDPYTSDFVAVGQGTDGTSEGVYVTELLDEGYDGTWTTPVRIASLNSPTSDFAIESVTAAKGSIWVGLQRPTVVGVQPKHTLYLVHGISGEWGGAIPLPHSTAQDGSLRLLLNPATGHLHAAFTRVVLSSKTNKSGIMQEARVATKWSQPTYFTHWYRDVADQITINQAGRAVIGYEQK
jgi:hypothetical protein